MTKSVEYLQVKLCNWKSNESKLIIKIVLFSSFPGYPCTPNCIFIVHGCKYQYTYEIESFLSVHIIKFPSLANDPHWMF